MKQWDIYLFPFTQELPHPAVIISSDERCQNKDLPVVNALLCTTVRLNREIRKNEAFLDESDGLDWKTAVRCDVIHLLLKDEFLECRGRVIPQRRKEITKSLIRSLQLPSPW